MQLFAWLLVWRVLLRESSARRGRHRQRLLAASNEVNWRHWLRLLGFRSACSSPCVYEHRWWQVETRVRFLLYIARNHLNRKHQALFVINQRTQLWSHHSSRIDDNSLGRASSGTGNGSTKAGTGVGATKAGDFTSDAAAHLWITTKLMIFSNKSTRDASHFNLIQYLKQSWDVICVVW